MKRKWAVTKRMMMVFMGLAILFAGAACQDSGTKISPGNGFVEEAALTPREKGLLAMASGGSGHVWKFLPPKGTTKITLQSYRMKEGYRWEKEESSLMVMDSVEKKFFENGGSLYINFDIDFDSNVGSNRMAIGEGEDWQNFLSNKNVEFKDVGAGATSWLQHKKEVKLGESQALMLTQWKKEGGDSSSASLFEKDIMSLGPPDLDADGAILWQVLFE